LVDAVPDDDQRLHEMKYDAYRVTIALGLGRPSPRRITPPLWSRTSMPQRQKPRKTIDYSRAPRSNEPAIEWRKSALFEVKTRTYGLRSPRILSWSDSRKTEVKPRKTADSSRARARAFIALKFWRVGTPKGTEPAGKYSRLTAFVNSSSSSQQRFLSI
jgi:hypothetical protein